MKRVITTAAAVAAIAGLAGCGTGDDVDVYTDPGLEEPVVTHPSTRDYEAAQPSPEVEPFDPNAPVAPVNLDPFGNEPAAEDTLSASGRDTGGVANDPER